MTANEWLQATVLKLTGASIPTARLDALVLLEDATGKDRAWLLAHPEHPLTASQLKVLEEQISKRELHTPLAYLRGKTEFYGREFLVNDFVLEPRPESETMIAMLKTIAKEEFAADNGLTIIDVGTGSGALAITAKLELPDARVIAIDIDPNCLELTRSNADKIGADIEIIEGDLISPLSGIDIPSRSMILICNLPYVPDSFQINQAATHEPRLAIFGGPDGLDLYRTLFDQVDHQNSKPTFVMTEAMPPQHEVIAEIAAAHGFAQTERDDFIQVFVPIS